jgi:hypothetical protein
MVERVLKETTFKAPPSPLRQITKENPVLLIPATQREERLQERGKEGSVEEEILQTPQYYYMVIL